MVCARQLVHHGQFVLHLLGVVGAYGLLPLTCTSHAGRRCVRLLRLSLLLQEVLMQEVVCIRGHELVREAVLHAQQLVALVKVLLLRSLLLHIGCMLLLLLL